MINKTFFVNIAKVFLYLQDPLKMIEIMKILAVPASTNKYQEENKYKVLIANIFHLSNDEKKRLLIVTARIHAVLDELQLNAGPADRKDIEEVLRFAELV
jgi:hypothetical protein